MNTSITPVKASIINFINKELGRLGISKREVAALTGLHYNTVLGGLNKQFNISYDAINRILDVLNLELAIKLRRKEADNE